MSSATPDIRSSIRLFYSYSHKDEDLRNELEKHLTILKRQGLITSWHDRRIGAGKEWEKEINYHLENSQIILLLISADFIASDYCYSVEMKRALQQHETGESRVIPIMLRPVDWEEAPFSRLQILPTDAKAVTLWEDTDEAFTIIAQGIRKAIRDINNLPERFTGIWSSYKGEFGSSSHKQRIGQLLPFLCNRNEQESALSKALQYQRQKLPRRPFICITHGNEYECHDMFKKRLKDVFLPRFFKLSNTEGSIEDYLLQWPPMSLSEKEALEMFQREVAETLSEDRDTPLEEALEHISKHKAPILIYSYLSVDNWATTGPRFFNSYIQFWRTLPDLPSGHFIISCLFFTYKGTERAGFFEKRKLINLIEKARRFFEQPSLLSYENIHGVVLPELDAIPRHDVENWIRDGRNFTGLCDVHHREFCNLQGAIEAIRLLYEQPEVRALNDRIPMEHLSKELHKLLERYHCKGA